MLADQPCKYDRVCGYRQQFSSSRFYEASSKEGKFTFARTLGALCSSADLNPINTLKRAEPRRASLIKGDQLHDREISQLVGNHRWEKSERKKERTREGSEGKESERTYRVRCSERSADLLSQRDARRITASSQCNLIGRNTRSLIKHSTNY